MACTRPAQGVRVTVVSAASSLGRAGEMTALYVRFGGSSLTISAATAIEDPGRPSAAKREAPLTSSRRGCALTPATDKRSPSGRGSE